MYPKSLFLSPIREPGSRSAGRVQSCTSPLTKWGCTWGGATWCPPSAPTPPLSPGAAPKHGGFCPKFGGRWGFLGEWEGVEFLLFGGITTLPLLWYPPLHHSLLRPLYFILIPSLPHPYYTSTPPLLLPYYAPTPFLTPSLLSVLLPYSTFSVSYAIITTFSIYAQSLLHPYYACTQCILHPYSTLTTLFLHLYSILNYTHSPSFLLPYYTHSPSLLNPYYTPIPS